jgi:hydroxyethylthiazole kinase-like uncharacterized protein yjeF
MRPVLTPTQAVALDRRVDEPTAVLVERAGAAVALAARRMLGQTYGRHVLVVAGKGNNGADGHAAARRLRRAGARVTVLAADALAPDTELPLADLVVDAAFGTGLTRPYQAPRQPQAPVLAVDIPSGVSGLTGEVVGNGTALVAARTVTLGAWKPGLLLGAGAELAGSVEVAGIGLEDLAVEAARAWLIEDGDVDKLGVRGRDGHKWQTSVLVVAGSGGMTGAPWLVSRAAFRSGAGYVRLGMPGVEPTVLPPSEVVGVRLPPTGWDTAALDGIERFRALVVGPGLGRQAGAGGELERLLVSAPLPVVLDADGLNAVGTADALGLLVAQRRFPTVITPHAGEFARLTGHPPASDRLESCRQLAARTGAVVLLKGSTTVVAEPGGRVLLASTGSGRLATAGTGDVLSGVIGSFIARGGSPFEAAALAAHTHGRAAGLGRADGLVAGDLPDLVSQWLSSRRH